MCPELVEGHHQGFDRLSPHFGMCPELAYVP